MHAFRVIAVFAVIASSLAVGGSAGATPVCTDGFRGGPPRAVCGGRIFPEAELARSYVQYQGIGPEGFREYQDGVEYLSQVYPRWVSSFTLRRHYRDKNAASVWQDRTRPYDKGDTGDGLDILVIKITDHRVKDRGKMPLFFSLSVHGNERGGLEGGLRTAEDLAMAATSGGVLTDGVEGYESSTGRKPTFHEYEVRDLLKKEVVYLVDFNPDGWAIGDTWHGQGSRPYARGNALGTDLNRQMPTIGRINASRNPLQESEMRYGHRFMHDVARKGPRRLMAYGADVHGELTSNAYVDIMYPAGEFNSIQHRRLMAIAERTKSAIDATLYEGIQNHIEEATGGDEGEGPAGRTIPTKPAHWATVWDTLGYTDTGFIGDYLATDLAVTGMDYEIFLNHTVPDRAWNVYLQENHINATRQIIKTAMAYAPFQSKEFNGKNFKIDTIGRAGYVFNPDKVTDRDENGPGTLPGPQSNGTGQDGKKVRQRHYSVSNMKWFEDTNRILKRKFVRILPGDVARSWKALASVDTLVLADDALPADARGRKVDAKSYFGNIRSWVSRGGNLVLTDRALHALGRLDVVDGDAVSDIRVYQPFADIEDFDHPMVKGLLPNARQLVEAPILGYGIGSDASPMTVVAEEAFTQRKGHVVGTTGSGRVSVGQVPLGKGQIRILGGALPTPTEENDHRYGLRNYALTYTGLYIMENSIQHDAKGLGHDGKDRRKPQVVASSLLLPDPLFWLGAVAGILLACAWGQRRRLGSVPGPGTPTDPPTKRNRHAIGREQR